MNKKRLYDEIVNLLKKNNENDHEYSIKLDVPLKDYTSFKVGGPADILVEPGSIDNMITTLNYFNDQDISYFVLGNGSNVIFRDGGYRGVVITTRFDNRKTPMSCDNTVLKADAGVLLSTLAKYAAQNSLSGMESVSGIPGSIGGAVYMNAGAYGGEIKDIITSAEVYDPESNQIQIIKADDMDLGYRRSVFQSNKKVILNVEFRLEKSEKVNILEQMKELTIKRNSKQPVNYPSAGSFFKRPEGHFAGKLVEEAGLKGLKKGGAQISELHSGFMINKDGATAQDIEDLMEVVRAQVYEKFGVMLEPEVKILGESK